MYKYNISMLQREHRSFYYYITTENALLYLSEPSETSEESFATRIIKSVKTVNTKVDTRLNVSGRRFDAT